MNSISEGKLTVQVYASEKVRPAFELLERLTHVQIHFTDWSFSPRQLLQNIAMMAKADVIYFHSPANMRILMMPIARLLGKPVMLQWIGSDVLTVTWRNREPFWDIGAEKDVSVKEVLLGGLVGPARLMVALTMRFARWYAFFLRKLVTHHVVCASHLVEELRAAGIAAQYLPVLNFINPELLPFPDDFAILTYIGFHATSDKRTFYGWHSMVRLARDYPDLTIFVVGRSLIHDDYPANLIFLGYLDDIRQVFSKVKAIVRLTYHDGMPRIILEGLATARYIIYNQRLPHTFYVDNYDKLKKAIEKIRKISALNLAGLQYMEKMFAPEVIARQFVKEFEAARIKNG